MKIAGSLVASLMILSALSSVDPRSDRVSRDEGSRSTVLLELFTSQGCSSCPPADALLSELARDGTLGDRVVPLAFHVDYWNRLGWQDPFSKSVWSDRQRRYAARLDGHRVYTPQLVIDGVEHVVGSNELAARSAIHKALKHPSTIEFVVVDEWQENQVVLNVSVKTKSPMTSEAELYAAIWESGFETRVGRGENGGRTLRNDFVVRDLVRLGLIPSAAGTSEHSEIIPVRFDRRDSPKGIAVFVQDRASSRILGAVNVRRAVGGR